MAYDGPVRRVQATDEPSLLAREGLGELQLLPMPTMQPDDGGAVPVLGGGGVDMPDSQDVADGVMGPFVLTVTGWLDREPDLSFGALPPWLAAAFYGRASELAYDMAEADWEEATDNEEEEE